MTASKNSLKMVRKNNKKTNIHLALYGDLSKYRTINSVIKDISSKKNSIDDFFNQGSDVCKIFENLIVGIFSLNKKIRIVENLQKDYGIDIKRINDYATKLASKNIFLKTYSGNSVRLFLIKSLIIRLLIANLDQEVNSSKEIKGLLKECKLLYSKFKDIDYTLSRHFCEICCSVTKLSILGKFIQPNPNDHIITICLEFLKIIDHDDSNIKEIINSFKNVLLPHFSTIFKSSNPKFHPFIPILSKILITRPIISEDILNIILPIPSTVLPSQVEWILELLSLQFNTIKASSIKKAFPLKIINTLIEINMSSSLKNHFLKFISQLTDPDQSKSFRCLKHLYKMSKNIQNLFFKIGPLILSLADKSGPKIHKILSKKLSNNQCSAMYFLIKNNKINDFQLISTFFIFCYQLNLEFPTNNILEYIKLTISHHQKILNTPESYIDFTQNFLSNFDKSDKSLHKISKLVKRVFKHASLINTELKFLIYKLIFGLIFYNIDNCDSIKKILKDLVVFLKKDSENILIIFEIIVSLIFCQYRSAHNFSLYLIKNFSNLFNSSCFDYLLNIVENPMDFIKVDQCVNDNSFNETIDNSGMDIIGTDVNISSLESKELEELEKTFENKFSSISKVTNLKKQKHQKNDDFIIRRISPFFLALPIHLFKSKDLFLFSLRIISALSVGKKKLKSIIDYNTKNIHKSLYSSEALDPSNLKLIYSKLTKLEKRLSLNKYDENLARFLVGFNKVIKKSQSNNQKYTNIIQRIIFSFLEYNLTSKDAHSDTKFFQIIFDKKSEILLDDEILECVSNHFFKIRGNFDKFNRFYTIWITLIQNTTNWNLIGSCLKSILDKLIEEKDMKKLSKFYRIIPKMLKITLKIKPSLILQIKDKLELLYNRSIIQSFKNAIHDIINQYN